MKEHYNSYKPIPFVLILPDKATMMGNPQQALLTPLWNQSLIKPPKLICKNTGKIKTALIETHYKHETRTLTWV